MTDLRELKNETTLSAVAENPEGNNHYLLFAIIIDISEPYKTEESTNFTTKLKVIDPSFNYKANIDAKNLKFHKFVHVNIYSETPESAPRIQYVGDIIRLRRFKFRLTEKGELMGTMQKYSNWLIYSGDMKGPEVSECFKSYDKNKNRTLNANEQGRLSDLRKWNDNFFFSNSLQFITWWTKCSPPDNVNKVDLILKCYKINAKNQTLFFHDEEKTEYELTLKVPPNNIENNVIKLRCVNVQIKKNKPSIIKLTSFSSCLLVPHYFYDARKFQKIAKNQKSKTKDQKFEFMGNYEVDKKTPDCITAIKNNHNAKKVSVADLEKKLKSPSQYLNQKFVVDGFVTGLVSSEPETVIKILEGSSVHDLNTKLKKGANYKYIYNIILLLSDKKKGNPLSVYLTTNDGEQNVFTNWEILPEGTNTKAWANVKQKELKNFEKKLKALASPKHSVKFIVQLVKTKGGESFLKLVDTVFLPF